ncbi:MAG: UDP-N-acetylmuramoyl-tripeptide--D-alanyl-D-alanine ligase [Actinomycetota bacterium]|nr:UDP-N-acetylmuramoyl-tripeptide--D-alanyl-D-alanine ligase [Actinomycetota bacterium]
MRLRATELAAMAGGTLSGPDVEVDGACIDSRLVRGGELFVAIRAGRDGHEFIETAQDAGAAAWMGSHPHRAGTGIVVDDSAAALTRLGTATRARLPDRVVGITGSVGKTSTKDLLAAALARRFRVSASPKSFNNELGVPLTLLNVADGVEAVVVEMGARGPGHVAALCAVARPVIGVVTTVGVSHAAFFGTIEDVARAKGELIEALPPHGTAVLNADVPLVAAMAARATAQVLTFGVGVGAGRGDVRAEEVTVDAELRPRFRLYSPWGEAQVALEVRGQHQVANALAAAAAALACGAGIEDVAAGLGDARLSPWRMQLERSASGALILNDAYNANPLSAEAALRALVGLPVARHTALLGAMAELGDVGPSEHARIGALAAELGIRVIAVNAPEYGGEQAGDVEEALDRLGPVGTDDAVLVKASRSAGLEALAATLVGTATT